MKLAAYLIAAALLCWLAWKLVRFAKYMKELSEAGKELDDDL